MATHQQLEAYETIREFVKSRIDDYGALGVEFELYDGGDNECLVEATIICSERNRYAICFDAMTTPRPKIYLYEAEEHWPMDEEHFWKFLFFEAGF